MKDNKRYYWIKLKTDFFNQETIDFLLSQKNGCEYIVLYQMLCLNTANNNGEMCSKIGEMIVPYNVDKIVRDTKYFDFDKNREIKNRPQSVNPIAVCSCLDHLISEARNLYKYLLPTMQPL